MFVKWITALLLVYINGATPTTDSLQVQTHTLYMSKKTNIEPTRCVGYAVNANYRRVEMLINSRHLDHVIVSDVEFEECDIENYLTCPEDSTFCLTSKNLEGSWRFTVGKCLSRFYVYIYILDYQDGDISARLNNDKGCDNIAETEYTTCASIPLDECGLEEDLKKCNANCFRLDCTYVDPLKKNRTALSSCLPSFLNDDKFNEYCQTENYYYNEVYKAPVAHYCGGKNSRRIPRSIEQFRELSFWQMILTLVIIAVCIFIMCVIWYRMSLSRTGVAPFNPPAWMPESIFPRPRAEQPIEMTFYHQM